MMWFRNGNAYPGDYPWRSVVRLLLQDSAGGWSLGSGTMIRPNVVLTAAHNLEPDPRRVAPGVITAAATATLGTDSASAPRTPAHGIGFWVNSEWRVGYAASEDYALVLLDLPLVAPADVLSIRDLPAPRLNGVRAFVAGYPGPPPGQNLMVYRCSLYDPDGENLYANVPVEEGVSGGPVLLDDSSIARVGGVISYTAPAASGAARERPEMINRVHQQLQVWGAY